MRVVLTQKYARVYRQRHCVIGRYVWCLCRKPNEQVRTRINTAIVPCKTEKDVSTYRVSFTDCGAHALVYYWRPVNTARAYYYIRMYDNVRELNKPI